ncbi:DUF6507 family protein [Streptomyces anandii]|uniref:DUF6507 family protein n=1 Tax=Streptomyces anandii TaxID=285454 RepID=UPI0036F613FD
MQGWDITPSGVGFVVSRVEEVMNALGGIVTAYAEDMEGAARSAGTLAPGGADGEGKGRSGLVAAALAEFMTGTADERQFIGLRVGKSLGGAVEATAAYEAGDLEMAAQTQARAAGLVKPDMPEGWKAGRL